MIGALLFAISFLGILGGIAFLLKYLKVHAMFIITFFFHGSIYLSASVWESGIWGGNTNLHATNVFTYGLWLLSYGLIGCSFLAMFIDKEGFNKHKIVIFGGLLMGDWMFFGVLEDFGCFIIWGVERTFNPSFAYWHLNWIFGLFPTFYLMAIPGAILIILSLWKSRTLDQYD